MHPFLPLSLSPFPSFFLSLSLSLFHSVSRGLFLSFFLLLLVHTIARELEKCNGRYLAAPVHAGGGGGGGGDGVLRGWERQRLTWRPVFWNVHRGLFPALRRFSLLSYAYSHSLSLSLSLSLPLPRPTVFKKEKKKTVRGRAQENRANYSSLRLHNSTVNLITARSHTRALAAHGGQVPSQYNNRRRIHHSPPPADIYRTLPCNVASRCPHNSPSSVLATCEEEKRKKVDEPYLSYRVTLSRVEYSVLGCFKITYDVERERERRENRTGRSHPVWLFNRIPPIPISN